MPPSAAVADRAARRFGKPGEGLQVALQQMVGGKSAEGPVDQPPQHEHRDIRFRAGAVPSVGDSRMASDVTRLTGARFVGNRCGIGSDHLAQVAAS
jgi:hypothetical protein